MDSLKARLLAAVCCVGGLVGCGTATASDLAQEASALTSAQCAAQGDRAAVDACFTAFEACKTAAGADEAACRTTLRACLPTPPPRPERAGGPDGGCGGGPRGHGPGGGLGAPPADGQRPPPPAFDGDGGVRPPHGAGGPGGHGGRGPVEPDSAAVTACHDALATCLAAGTAEADCRDAEHQCMHEARAAAFAERCAQVQAECATTTDAQTPCAAIAARCAEGPRPPRAEDGGLVCP